MLDRAGYAARDVERRRDALAGLTDLMSMRDPTGVDRRARRPDRAAERSRQLFDDVKMLRAAKSASSGYHNARFIHTDGSSFLRDVLLDDDTAVRGGCLRECDDLAFARFLARRKRVGAAEDDSDF